MTGRRQHEIPQLFQRGFLKKDTGDAERVYVFRRGGKIYQSNIDKSGAERDFYSKPSPDEDDTLDDVITDYEAHLFDLVCQLRKLPVGHAVDSLVAAEVIVHLTGRNAHLRGAFTHAVKEMASTVSTAFGDQQNLFNSLGLNESKPGDRFKELVLPCVREDPLMQSLGLPEAVLERVLFFFAKENFSETSREFSNLVVELSTQMEMKAKEIAANGHKKALAQSVTPPARVAGLSAFSWEKKTTDADLILPDCVAIGLNNDGEPHPLMMADPDEMIAILLPLSSRSVLVGTKDASYSFEPGDLNSMAASCSHTYFICGSKTSDTEELVRQIGRCSVMIVEKALKDGTKDFLESQSAIETSCEVAALEPQEVSETAELSAPSLPERITVNYSGHFTQEVAGRISQELQEIVAEATWTVPLDRLDGIAFADDYPGTLHKLDRGFPEAGPIHTSQNEDFAGVAQSPTVIRNGVLKGHLVVVGWLARALIGDDEALKITAMHTIVQQLASVGFTQVFDETLPGVLLSPFKDKFEGDLHSCVYPAWKGYFAARASAKFGPDHLSEAEEVLILVLRQAQSKIPRSRLNYRHHGDLNVLLQEVLPRVGLILEHAGKLLGHSDGLEQHTIENETLLEMLKEMHLYAWMKDFRAHLGELWDQRGVWDSFDDFLLLNRHTERIVWQFGIFPWRTDTGEYRVEIPLATDANALLEFMEGQGSPKPQR